MFNYIHKVSIAAIAMLSISAVVHAQTGPRGKLLLDLGNVEIETQIEQKKLALQQAKRASLLASGASAGELPTVISIYGRGATARAMLDLGAAGVRDVAIGDRLGQSISVASIDVGGGVALRMGDGKTASLIDLPMKAVVVSQPGQPGQPGQAMNMMQAGITVPPIQPLGIGGMAK